MSISIEAKDFYGLPLHIGDSVFSGVVHLSGKITDIYKDEGHLWITIFDEKTQKSINHLNPNVFTTPERHTNKKIKDLEKENANLKQRLEKSEAARLDNL